MYLDIGILVLFGVIAVALLVYASAMLSRKSKAWFFLIPLAIFSAVLAYPSLQFMSGLPMNVQHLSESVYLKHLRLRDKVYIWMLDQNVMVPVTIALDHPSDELMRALQEASAATGRGQTVMISKHHSAALGQEIGGGTYGSVGGSFMLYNFSTAEHGEKEGSQ